MKISIFIILFFSVLMLAASQNLTDSENEIIYVCDENNTNGDKCICRNGFLYCFEFSDPIKTGNIKIMNKTFVLKYANLRIDTETLNKDKLLPGRENTVEDLALSLHATKTIEAGILDKFTSLKKLTIYETSDFGDTEKPGLTIDDNILTKSVGSTLKYLSLFYGINSLPPTAFQHLIQLTNLSLTSNFNIPSSLSKELFAQSLINLKELQLSYCNISSIDDDVFINLRNLIYLDLSLNPLTTIPKAINSLIKLEYLNFVRTKTVVLKNNGFTVNENLKLITIRDSPNLISIEDCAFCSFPNLEKLYLWNNKKLERIHENAFGALNGTKFSNLKTFKIKDSNLKVLPEKLLNWESVKEIRIDGNTFVCNCSMAWLINDFVNPSPKYYKNLRGIIPYCQSPPEYKGNSFQDVAGTICTENNNVITDNRITVCDTSSAYDASPCKCYEDRLTCKTYVMFQSTNSVTLNLKIKDKNFILKHVTFEGIPVFSLKKGKILRDREHTIESIELQDCSVSKIEEKVFDDFVSLKTLKICENEMESLNDSFLTSKIGINLEELNLSKNRFKNISFTSFQHLKKLRTLSLSRNREISKFMTKELFSKSLTNLTSLHLDFCEIHHLDDDVFINLINLEYIYLNRNPLTTIPKALIPLSKLNHLDLSATEIEILTNYSFNIFNYMESFDMDSMPKLKEIENCALCIFPNLTQINLEKSKNLERIDENAFGAISGKTPKLEAFVANGCKLSTLSEKLINWDTIRWFSIPENPFICNCSIAWLINDFAYSNPISNYRDYYIAEKSGLECAGPPMLKNKTFKEISNKLCNTSFTKDGMFEKVIQEETNINRDSVGKIVGAIIFSIFAAALIYLIFYHPKNSKSEEISSPKEAVNLNEEEIALNNL